MDPVALVVVLGAVVVLVVNSFEMVVLGVVMGVGWSDVLGQCEQQQKGAGTRKYTPPVVCQTGLFGPLFQKQANIDIGLFSKTSNINIEVHFLHFFFTDVANAIGQKSLIKIETFLQLLSFCPSHKTGNARQYEGLWCYCVLLD